jgi:plasmid stabilization system protein ParE
MRDVVLTDRAAERLDEQLAYLTAQGAADAAERVRARIEEHLAVISQYPRTGRYRHRQKLWEAWVPKTRLVVWYRFDDAQIVAIAIWHTAQQRR